MEADFPAAHSMDTAWFAVDRAGHVGYFQTHEAGAVPSCACGGDGAQAEAAAVGERLARLLPRGEAAFDLAGRTVPGLGEAFEHQGFLLGLGYPVLLFLPSLSPVREALASGQAVQVPSGDAEVVIFQRLPPDLGRRLHDSGACLGCFYLFGYDADGGFDAPRLGLFAYEHLTENWISGPYGRVARPLRPLHVDQLPPDLRAVVKQMRFADLSFAEAMHVQPVEHAECESWEPAYLDVTGKRIRPLPGREADYVEAFKHLGRLGQQGIEVEPPRGAAGQEGAES